MAINFPDPTESPWYNDPSTGGNGVTYEYTAQGYWTAVSVTGNNAIDIGTGDGRYVNLSGDTMTGDLGIGAEPFTALHAYKNIGGANPATTGTTDTNVFTRLQGGSVAFDLGGISSGLQWIQPRDVNDFSNNFGLGLCPNGGNVGIGTTNPGAKAHISAAYNETGLLIAAGGENYGNPLMVNAAGGDSLFTIMGNGNVGIGTTIPGTQLGFPIGEDVKISQTLLNPHSAANVGHLALTISDGGGHSGVYVNNIHNGTFSSQEITFLTAEGGVTGADERLRINGLGRLLHGTTVPAAGAFGTIPYFHTASSGNTNLFQNYGNTKYPARIDLCKTRGTTVNDHVIVQKDDTIGGVYFGGSDGTDYALAAQIEVFAEDTPGNNDMPGVMVFATTGDGEEFSTERMRISSSGNIGINKTVPVGKVHVYSDENTATYLAEGEMDNPGYPAYGFAGQNLDNGLRGAGMYLPDDGKLAFSTASVGRMFINSLGYVGIGTDNPVVPFVISDANRNIEMGYSGAGANHYIQAYDRNSSSYTPIYLAGSDVRIGSRGANADESARFDSSGRLLLGTTSTLTDQTQQLQVEGTSFNTGGASLRRNSADEGGTALRICKSRGTTSGSYTSVQNGDTLGLVQFCGADGDTDETGAEIRGIVDSAPGNGNMPGRLIFSTNSGAQNANPTERMRIGSAGNVFIGTTSAPSGAGLQIDSISDNDNVGALYVRNLNTNDAACAAAFSTGTNSTASSNALIKFGIDNYAAGSGGIYANGSGQAAFGTFSDERLKANVVDLPSQWENIKNLRPVEFDFIESQGGEHQIGFIAQEFENVYPDAVGSSPIFVGAEETSDEERLTITGWSKTESRLVKALQEAMERIETLEQQLADAGL